MTDTVVVSSASKWFGLKVAVSEVTVSFGPGVTGLLGPNGAGKTTLMRLISGLQKPSQGQIRVLDLDPRQNVELYRRVALVPEDEAVYEAKTALEFVTLSARLAGLEDPVDRAGAALAKVNLADAADRSLGKFSKGMRQRAKVAYALVTDPEVLLLDEPLNGADPVQRAELIRIFQELGDAGTTVVVSSHILAEVERMAQRVVAMVDGRLAAVGDVATIRSAMTDRPRLVFVECSDPRRLAGELIGVEGVIGVSLKDSTVRIEAAEAGAVAMALPAIATRNGIGIVSVTPADESLESVFRYLVGHY